MAELKVRDWRPSKCGRYQKAQVKKGYTRYGEIRKYPDGATVYVTIKKPDEVILNLDAWSIETETLRMLKMRCVPFISIEVTNGDRYVTRTADFEDESKGAGLLTYIGKKGRFGREGIAERYLPRASFMSVQYAPPETALQVMLIKGRR